MNINPKLLKNVNEQLTLLNNKIDNKKNIYKTTVSGTTDSNGFLTSSLKPSEVVVMGTAVSTNQDGFYFSYENLYADLITIRCLTYNFNPIENTNISCDIYYILK